MYIIHSRAVEDSRTIMEESKVLFEALETKASFARMAAVVSKKPKPE